MNLILYYTGPFWVLCRRDACLLLRKFYLNTGNDGASAKANPLHALIVLGKKQLSILTSCMTNLSKFHVVFSSRTLIHLNKDAFEGHLCRTVNNFVKQNKSSLLSPLRERCPPQHIKYIFASHIMLGSCGILINNY